MRWSHWRRIAWIDTRARFVASPSPGARLLDLGTSDGKTLRHFVELRPDLVVAAADIAGTPENYPAGTEFRSADFDADRLPWPADSFDAITCMHVVEHLPILRVLKPRSRARYVAQLHWTGWSAFVIAQKPPPGAQAGHSRL